MGWVGWTASLIFHGGWWVVGGIGTKASHYILLWLDEGCSKISENKFYLDIYIWKHHTQENLLNMPNVENPSL